MQFEPCAKTMLQLNQKLGIEALCIMCTAIATLQTALMPARPRPRDCRCIGAVYDNLHALAKYDR